VFFPNYVFSLSLSLLHGLGYNKNTKIIKKMPQFVHGTIRSIIAFMLGCVTGRAWRQQPQGHGFDSLEKHLKCLVCYFGFFWQNADSSLVSILRYICFKHWQCQIIEIKLSKIKKSRVKDIFSRFLLKLNYCKFTFCVHFGVEIEKGVIKFHSSLSCSMNLLDMNILY